MTSFWQTLEGSFSAAAAAVVLGCIEVKICKIILLIFEMFAGADRSVPSGTSLLCGNQVIADFERRNFGGTVRSSDGR